MLRVRTVRGTVRTQFSAQSESGVTVSSLHWSIMRSFLLYNVARLGMLVACVLVIWTIWGRSLWGAIAGIVISALLSFIVLAPLRNKSAEELIGGMERRREAKKAAPQKKRHDESAEDRSIDDA